MGCESTWLPEEFFKEVGNKIFFQKLYGYCNILRLLQI